MSDEITMDAMMTGDFDGWAEAGQILTVRDDSGDGYGVRLDLVLDAGAPDAAIRAEVQKAVAQAGSADAAVTVTSETITARVVGAVIVLNRSELNGD